MSYLGWIGTICVLAGRVFFVYGLMDIGFAVSVTGDILWLAYGIKARIWSLALLDAVLLVTDITGVMVHIR